MERASNAKCVLSDQTLTLKSTEFAKEEGHRWKDATPVFTDGVFLYLFTFRETKNNEDGEEVWASTLVLEQWCPAEWVCKRQVHFDWEEDKFNF